MQAKAWVMLADEMPWVVSIVSVELNWDKGSECDLLGNRDEPCIAWGDQWA